MHAFSIKSTKGRVNILKTNIVIKLPNSGRSIKAVAIWDTGASASVVTQNIVRQLGLIPTGMQIVNTANGQVTQPSYIVDVILPNNVGFRDVTVTGIPDLNGDCDVLIGMDIIGKGDFSVTNFNGSTCMSFRLPSCHEIDYVKDPHWKHGEKTKNTPKANNPYANVSRNDTCPCNSGKKFKHCHGK